MTFQDAMTAVFDGKRVRRDGWVPNVYIACNELAESYMIFPVIIAAYTDGLIEGIRVYELSRMDFFAKDWEIVQ